MDHLVLSLVAAISFLSGAACVLIVIGVMAANYRAVIRNQPSGRSPVRGHSYGSQYV